MPSKFTTRHTKSELATILEALADKFRETGALKYRNAIVQIFLDTGMDPPQYKKPSSRTDDHLA